MHLSLSVEDTNRLRARLGLKLIPTEPQPRNNTVDLIERVSAAQQRANNRTSQVEVTNVDFPVKPVSIEPTKAWLTRINHLMGKKHNENVAEQSAATDTTQDTQSISVQLDHNTANHSKSESEKVAEERIKDGNSPSGRPSDRNAADSPSNDSPPSEIPPGSPSHGSPSDQLESDHLEHDQLEHSQLNQTRPESTVTDPLDLPGELHASQPHLPKPKAVFKSKKIKQVSKPRERQKYTQTYPNKSGINEDQYYSMLLKNAARRAAPPKEEIIDNEPTPTSNLIQTKAFLEAIKDIREDDPVVDKQDLETEISNPLPKADKINEERGGGGMSVAETLEMLRTQRNSAPAVNKSRGWARKLLLAREQREKERHELENKVRFLPANQREQALALHKERLMAEMANDAKLLADNYEPDVVLEHRDEHGNMISSRDAFKKMSRAFHGQSHGKPHDQSHGLAHDQ